MANTQAQLDAIEVLIASGVSAASYGDKRTEMRSFAELREIRADVTASISGKKRIRQIRVTSNSDKGL